MVSQVVRLLVGWSVVGWLIGVFMVGLVIGFQIKKKVKNKRIFNIPQPQFDCRTMLDQISCQIFRLMIGYLVDWASQKTITTVEVVLMETWVRQRIQLLFTILANGSGKIQNYIFSVLIHLKLFAIVIHYNLRIPFSIIYG